MKHLLLAFAVFATTASASTISINFTDNGSVDSTMLPTDVAGAPGAGTRVAHWNNANVNGHDGTLDGLVDDQGSLLGGNVMWFTDLGQWHLGHTVATGDDRMWKGYMDVSNNGTLQVTLPFTGLVDVYIYFDGDNGSSWRIAEYGLPLFDPVFQQGEDSEGADWGVRGEENEEKVYQLPVKGGPGNQIWPVTPNNGEGNYVVFRNVPADFVLITASGVGSSSVPRAPINGIQFVQVQIPEPGPAALGAVSVFLALRRRRNGAACGIR